MYTKAAINVNEMYNELKEVRTIAIVGHVDSGKSTMTGALACRYGDFDKRMQEKLSDIAEKYGKKTLNLAYYTDRTKEERERGVTINTTMVPIETSKYRINIMDCPGHKDYVKNATSGCRQSDATIVVVPARFEASVGTEGTLFTHITLAAVLGSSDFIVCINKCDDIDKDSSVSPLSQFEAAKCAVKELFTKIGVNTDKIVFIPTSAFFNIGLFEEEKLFDWFPGHEHKDPKTKKITLIKTLEVALDMLPPPEKTNEKGLRAIVQNVYNIPGIGMVCGLNVVSGVLKLDQKFIIQPTGYTNTIKTLEEHKLSINEAQNGQNVGATFAVKNKTQDAKLKTGDVLAGIEDKETFKTYEFYAISGVNIKEGTVRKDSSAIKVNYTPMLTCGSTNVSTKFVKLFYEPVVKDKKKKGKSSKKETEKVEVPLGEKTEFGYPIEAVMKKEKFNAIICPTKPSLFELADDFSDLGKIVCRDQGKIVCAGKVIKKITAAQALTDFDINYSKVFDKKLSSSSSKSSNSSTVSLKSSKSSSSSSKK
ncbi:EF1A [Hepatospora eriocheir]|uniref:EF1A n=1 Tax=Hepatospora eriocheir TaxID=1081669 RepID=A0A1X0QAZ0_9MICR|nr:EF1A [Hepatospora eriocheir]